MGATALVAEILIVGLELEGCLALVVFAIFGWDWVDPAGLSDWIAPLTLAATALAYVLGIIADRVADSLFKRFRRKRKLPVKVPKMRMAVLAAKPGVAAFLDYQRSRMRVMRGTALNAALATFASLALLLARDAPVLPTVVVPIGLALGAVVAGWTFRRIDKAYVKRLRDAYEDLDAR